MSDLLLVEQVAPDVPSAGQLLLYFKADGKLYTMDDTGTETPLNMDLIFASQADLDASVAGKLLTADLKRISSFATVNPVSGSVIDFTGIPTGTSRITIDFHILSTTGTNWLFLLLGDSGGFETTGYESYGYDGAGTGSGSTTSFGIAPTLAATAKISGIVQLELVDSATNAWSMTSILKYGTTTLAYYAAGNKALSGILTQLRISTNGGTDTFDAGSVKVTFER